ncbi:MAG: hypothetical protein QM831_18300 [Kofleriaceae bacterium]
MTKSFRYGARLKVTAPLAAVFIVVAIEMVMLALQATTAWRIGLGLVGVIATMLAAAMLRETFIRIRGKRQIVIAERNVTVPSRERGKAETTIPFRDIRKLDLVGETKGFNRTLKIQHANGEHEIYGVMLGTVGELDEIYALIKATRKGL